jgi:hypothetical protein
MESTDAEALEHVRVSLTMHCESSRALGKFLSRDDHEQWLTLVDCASHL